MLSCEPSADDANGITALGMGYDQKPIAGRHPEGNRSFLRLGMVRVDAANCERVVEHARGFLKRNPMFLKVLFGFGGIPLELHIAILCWVLLQV